MARPWYNAHCTLCTAPAPALASAHVHSIQHIEQYTLHAFIPNAIHKYIFKKKTSKFS